ncbi:MAG: hypothetical protein AAB225_14760 [Acidobacteriota bacterium]
MKTTRRRFLQWAAVAAAPTQAVPEPHPRVLITPALLREIAEKVRGPFAGEYKVLLETAALGPRYLENQYSIPQAFMEAGLAWLIERELGRDGRQYAERVLAIWRQPQWQKPGLARHFGWQGLLYDWIYDAMTADERALFGELLGEWVATWWKTAEVNIDRSGWWYNQHWGPAHLDEPHNRVALTSKLFMSLATAGNAGRFEPAVQTNLRSFHEKFLRDGLPALDQMGGVWSESNGHGEYGPVLVVPLSYQAVHTGLGFDPFEASAEDGFAREYIRAGVWSLVPHNDKMAYIDDSSSGYPMQYARCAPLLARHYRDPVARWLSDTALKRGWLYNQYLRQNEVWQRVAFLPADLEATSPGEAGWPLAFHFRGAGHVYMRSAWDDQNATWAFFGAGPSYAGHSRDDEGHFLIAKRGQLVNRSGGRGHNDTAYYSGGSLIYNIVTIYHPGEKMRRSNYNENDGGLLRHVYEQRFPIERGHITAFWHDDRLATYAAADLTRGYWAEKAREVTRQFLYLRGQPECFVIFDRVEAASAEFPKIWFLHLPGEPEVSGAATELAPGHVTRFEGDSATWLSEPAGDTGMLSTGRGRIVMRTLLPEAPRITRRGGAGHDFWGHPYNPDAQYNHTLDRDGKEEPAYRQPPYSPWRLEVEPATPQARDYFLHLFYVTDEPAPEIPPAERIEEAGRLGARLTLGEREVVVLFDTAGPPGGRLKITQAGEVLHEGELG